MEDLILRYIHGSLSEDECDKLWDAMREDPELKNKFYMLEALYGLHHQVVLSD